MIDMFKAGRSPLKALPGRPPVRPPPDNQQQLISVALI
jgi:hypothetical protein